MYTYSLEKNNIQILPCLKPLLDAEDLVRGTLLPLPTIGSAGRTGDGDPPLILTDNTFGLCLRDLLCLSSDARECL